MRAVDLALKAGRALQSAQTGFVHLCYESPHSRETIPVHENIAFALALMRSKVGEQVLEGKAIVEKLLSFGVEDNFPVYLHEYPLCRDQRMAQRLAPYFFWMVKEFGGVLGSLTEKLKRYIIPLQPLQPLQAACSASDWAEQCIRAQMEGDETILQEAARHWNRHLGIYTGPSLKRPQEEGEPAVTLLDWMMGEWTGQFSKRALRVHPLQIRASLVRPASVTADASPLVLLQEPGELPFYLAWGDASQVHTLVLAKKHLEIQGDTILFPEEVPEEGDKSYELSLFLNVHPDHQLYVDGKKATIFRQEDTLSIHSKDLTITLQFQQGIGEGMFFGHLMRGNRPSQLSGGVYDWRIAVRTISRPSHCSLLLRKKLDYQQPLPSHAAHCLHTE